MPKFRKQLESLDAQSRDLIEKKLEAIFSGNVKPDVKKLVHTKNDIYRLRIGAYRLLFKMREETGEIMFCLCHHRKDLY